MIHRLKARLPDHEIIEVDAPELFVIDRTHDQTGGVEIHSQNPRFPHVYLANENCVAIYFDGFKQNALEIEAGRYASQCECIMFPQACNQTDWILVIETKYVDSIENAFRSVNDYPRGMINQIKETVKYFRDHGIIEQDRRVNAIVSFPTLIQDFDSQFFAGTESIEDILINHKIRIRATKTGRIISEKRVQI